MRIDRFVPENKRTGVSVYYTDYKKRLSVDDTRSMPTSVHRKNRPHPPKVSNPAIFLEVIDLAK